MSIFLYGKILRIRNHSVLFIGKSNAPYGEIGSSLHYQTITFIQNKRPMHSTLYTVTGFLSPFK